MNNIIVDKTYNVELLVKQSSTSSQIFFPIIQVLDSKYTQGINTYPVEIVPKAVSTTPLVNTPLLKSSFLTLVMGDENQIWNLPLVDVITTQQNLINTPFNQYAYEFNNLKIIWAKSYITIADVSLISAVQDEVYMFTIKYTDAKPQ